MKALEHRIPPPMVSLIFAALMWTVSLTTPRHDLSPALHYSLIALSIGLGLFFCLAGVISFRKAKTTVNPLKPETASCLVSSGIYKISRNPMYVGFVLFLMAWNLYLSAPLAIFCILGFIHYMTIFQIQPEEKALINIFGDEFKHYQASVRRWL